MESHRRGSVVSCSASCAAFVSGFFGTLRPSSSVGSFSRPLTTRRAARPACRTRPVFTVVCEAAAPSPAPAEDEESLDETAMRAAEIHEVLVGLEEFKGRIIDDATKLAKKVRASKKELNKALENHPDIIKIDHHLAELRQELETLGDR